MRKVFIRLLAAPQEVKAPGRETDHSTPSVAEFKNAWSYNFTPSRVLMGYIFMGSNLVKHRDNFTLSITTLLRVSRFDL
jgi:hypothetical protein